MGINDFISSENQDNPEYIKAIVEAIEDTLNNSSAAENSNIQNDHDEIVSAHINEDSEQVHFSGFDSLYENMMVLEDQNLSKVSRWSR